MKSSSIVFGPWTIRFIVNSWLVKEKNRVCNSRKIFEGLFNYVIKSAQFLPRNGK